jgi:succinate dehydrogenase / fumarate reductase cytochrome b subunit
MAFSILHRATGVALAVGALMLVCWLVALADGPEAFAAVQEFLVTWYGRLLLFGWTWSLIYHLLAGLRHLVWDTGVGLGLPAAQASGYLAAVGSVVLTILVWAAAYQALGRL